LNSVSNASRTNLLFVSSIVRVIFLSLQIRVGSAAIIEASAITMTAVP
jgi:hypothetical protein